MGLGVAGAGPPGAQGKGGKHSGERSFGQGFQNFHEGFEYEAADTGCFFPASPFSILEASVAFSGWLVRGKAADSAPGADPKGLVVAPGPFCLLALGEGQGRGCSRLPLRLRGGLREGGSACAVTWTSGARAGSSAGADTRCANRTE